MLFNKCFIGHKRALFFLLQASPVANVLQCSGSREKNSWKATKPVRDPGFGCLKFEFQASTGLKATENETWRKRPRSGEIPSIHCTSKIKGTTTMNKNFKFRKKVKKKKKPAITTSKRSARRRNTFSNVCMPRWGWKNGKTRRDLWSVFNHYSIGDQETLEDKEDEVDGASKVSA